MNPFQIQCETCKSSLRVRDPGFVGQVHACPNCGSMVLIAAPASQAERESQATRVDANQPQLTKPTLLGLSDSLVADNSLFESPATQANESIPQETSSDEHFKAELARVETCVESSVETAVPAKLFIAKGPLIWLTLGMIATGGLTLVALWPTENAVAEVSKEVDATHDSDLPVAKSDSDRFNEEAPVKKLAKIDDLSQTMQVKKPTIDEGPMADPVIGSNTEPVELTRELPALPTPQEIASKEPSVDDAIDRHAMIDQPIAKFDPLDYDPTSIDMVLHAGVEQASDAEPLVEQIALLPTNDRPTEADKLQPSELEFVANQAISVAIIDMGAEPAEDSATKQLAMPIPKIELKKIPLATAIQLLSELSGAPITLDPIALKQAGIDARRKVNVIGEGISLGEALSTTLKTVRLAYRTKGSNVVTYRPGVEQSKSITHQLADLAGSNKADLETLLSKIGPPATADQGIKILDNGTIALDIPRRAQYELILLTERLRIARGLQPQSKYPRQLLSSEPVLAQLATALEHRTTFSFVTPTSLRRIFEHWSQATGLTILVDWESLSEIGLSPHSMLTASASQQSWIESLDGILEPIGAGWSPIDRQTIWISTAKQNAELEFVEFYPGLGETQAASLKSEHPEAKVVYDAASRSTIVRGNSATHRRSYALWLRK